MSKLLKSVIVGSLIAGVSAAAYVFFSSNTVAVLEPQGDIAMQQRDLIYIVTILMLIVVIPVFILTFLFAWRYRASNKTATYKPDWDSNKLYELLWWGIPLIIIAVISTIIWISSHRLDPYRPLDSSKPALEVQVVALEWKWLFVYPDQQIASVNFLQIPEDTPINFRITADAPMNSFWIPQLGGQVYAMAGMETKLHLIANSPGDYRGSSANLSGEGFAGMKFTVRATSQSEFERWVSGVKKNSGSLTFGKYKSLAEPSQNVPIVTYGKVDHDLYATIIMKYMPSSDNAAVTEEPNQKNIEH